MLGELYAVMTKEAQFCPLSSGQYDVNKWLLIEEESR